MHYHVILTKECNLNCLYCGGGSDTEPKEIGYTIPDLKRFMSRDVSPVIEFYGGEPLLRIDIMKEIMDTIPARFVIQTNGLFLDRIEKQYLEKFHSILLSIDGTKEVTDKNRAKGVYDRLIRNILVIRENGFNGDLVARMTVPMGTDISSNVRHLLELPGFDHVHWQLGFEMFWEGAEPGIDDWIESYNSGITLLVKWWMSEMERKGEVFGIIPFIGIMNTLLKNTSSELRCGSGIDFFTIMPDGRISACPVSIDYEFSIIGSIKKDAPASLCNKIRVGEPCLSCEIFEICGGRCLFVNHSRDMLRENGYTLICSTVKHLIQELKAAELQVRELIAKDVIPISGFEYPELNNGCEIIP